MNKQLNNYFMHNINPSLISTEKSSIDKIFDMFKNFISKLMVEAIINDKIRLMARPTDHNNQNIAISEPVTFCKNVAFYKILIDQIMLDENILYITNELEQKIKQEKIEIVNFSITFGKINDFIYDIINEMPNHIVSSLYLTIPSCWCGGNGSLGLSHFCDIKIVFCISKRNNKILVMPHTELNIQTLKTK
jgi:hypothetical protein